MPPDLLARLDTGELMPAEGRHEDGRRSLEERLGLHVVAYRAGHRCAELSLCRVLTLAVLPPRALGLIRAAEDDHRGVVFVAYERPLRLS